MKTKKIVVLGSCNTDMVIKSDRLPVPGETILGGEFIMNRVEKVRISRGGSKTGRKRGVLD